MSGDKSRTYRAELLRLDAADRRRDARDGGPAARGMNDEARILDLEARALLRPDAPPAVRCGEVVTVPGDEGATPWEISNTLRSRNQVAIDASTQRTRQLFDVGDADLLAAAIDLAQSVGARNSVEKMLAHQLATMHRLFMKTATRTQDAMKRQDVLYGSSAQDNTNEVCRLQGSMVRLMGAFCAGMETMQQMRRKASQTVEVRHITVAPGAQAVIGNVRTGGGGRRKRAAGRGSR